MKIINKIAKYILSLTIIILGFIHIAISQVNASALEGNWDLTIVQDEKEVPSWLHVQHSGVKTLVGQFVHTGGSARPISKVNFDNGKFIFSIPPQWEREGKDLQIEGMINGLTISGNIIYANGKKYNWTGVKAPSLKRTGEIVWGEPITLFNGKDLSGWKALGENQWKVVNGILSSPKSGANLVTESSFNDFKLHIEFRYSAHSNSGVYLRGRYEVQIEDGGIDEEPWVGGTGAIYGFIQPSENAAKEPGAWQSFDITLRGRMVTVYVNNKLVIYNQEIPGITGGAINSKENEPGPILLQGDHGPVDYRNIILTPMKG